MTAKIDILKEKNIKDILICSYRLYRSDLFKLIGIVLLLKGPYLILAYIVSRLTIPFLTGSMLLNEQSAANFEYIGRILIVEILELLFIPFISPISVSAVTIFISEKHLGRELTITESYKRLFDKIIPLLGTIFLTGIVISSGFIFAILVFFGGSQLASILFIAVPILSSVLWVWFAFVPQTISLEGEGGTGAMKRSKHLSNGYFKKCFILIPLVFVATLVIVWSFSYGFSKIFFFLGDIGEFLGKGVSNIISILLEPFRILIIPILYFDLRVRKEGFDQELLKRELKAEI